MREIPEFEKLQIQSLTARKQTAIEQDLGLHLMPSHPLRQIIFESAVRPAMRAAGLTVEQVEIAFDSDTALAEVVRWLMRAEVIVADLSAWNPDVAYVLGLCHALQRCPLMIALRPIELPFNLEALRCIRYDATNQGLHNLREELTRALRIFISASRAAG